VSLGAGTTLLRSFALQDDVALLATSKAVTAKAPFRHMVTPGGFRSGHAGLQHLLVREAGM